MAYYDQTLQKQTFYACTIYTILNILKYDFWVHVDLDWILKTVMHMEKIWALLPKGAYFAIIYPAMALYLWNQLKIKLKVKESYISEWLDSISMWWLGFKKWSKLYKELSRDGRMSYWDVDRISKADSSFYHNHWRKESNKTGIWIMVESRFGYPYWFAMWVLKNALKKDLYYDKARTLIPDGLESRLIQERTIQEAKRLWRTLSIKEYFILNQL